MSVFNKKRFTIKRFTRKPKGNAADGLHEESDDNIETQRVPESNTEEIIYPPVAEGAVPTFFHIGGLAKDCLVTGYKIGAWHFDCTSRVGDKLSFYSFGTGKPQFGNVSGGVGIAEKLGIFNMSQAWQTEGIVGTIGVNTGAAGGLINAMLRATYKNSGNYYTVDLQTGYEHTPIKFDLIVPIWKQAKAMGYVLLQPFKYLMFAYRGVYDIEEKQFDMHSIGAGFDNGSTEIGLKLENFQVVRGSFFQRLGDYWAFALKGTLHGEDAGTFAVGGQYQIDDNSVFKAMVRSDWRVGLVYKLMLGGSIGIMYHVGLDASSPIQGEHKVGISWSLKG